MATVNGTAGNDFIHRAGDGLPNPPGTTNITGVTTSGDTISGVGGDDIVHADAGNDLLVGGLGTDELHGGDGQDTLLAATPEEISGLAETLDGGEGNDALILNPLTDDQLFDLTQVTMTSVEWLLGAQRADGTDVLMSASQLSGLSDILVLADVHLDGVLSGQLPSTTFQVNNLFLGDGADRFEVTAFLGFDTLSAGGGDDRIRLTDTFLDFEALTIEGGDGNDRLRLKSSAGMLDGGTGKDRLNGGRFRDELRGGEGDDVLDGHHRQDTLTGGAGADRFVIAQPRDSFVGANRHDIVTDFSRAEGDKLDLSRMDADITQPDDQVFRLVAGGAFTGEAGEVIRFAGVGGETLVQGDVDGDGAADFEVALQGGPVLVDGDFLF